MLRWRYWAYRWVIAAAVAFAGCASGQRDAARAGDEGTENQARIEALEAELAAAQARVEALEAGREQVDRPAAAPLFTEDGLTDQLRRLFRPAALPESFEPGPTAWQEATIPPRFARDRARGFESAGALATAFAGEARSAALGIDLWEVTTRVLTSDDQSSASAAILSWGLKDDAVEGEDLRLEVRRGERGWYVESAEKRSWCRRGITDDQRCR